jgi:hypothetical protein
MFGHGAFVPLDDHAEFLDRPSLVHARVPPFVQISQT